jgi:hypothetical protein
MKFELPYLDHLAFQNQSQYKISNYNLFETLYTSLLENKDLQSNNSKIIEVENKCITILAQIFNELKEQATEEREILFLEDLFSHTDRLLKEDLDVYKTRIFSKNYKKTVNLFYDNKFTTGKISKESLDRINFEIKDSIDLFRKNAALGKTTRENLSINHGKVVRKVVNELNKEFKNNGILDLLSEYMGIRQTVIGVSVELSVPNSNWWNVDYSVYKRQPKTLYFHYDESISYPKSIVYLSNVDENNGATSCTPSLNKNLNLSSLQFIVGRAIACVGKTKGTKLNSFYNHKYHQTFGCPIFKNDFSKLPNELRFSSHFGWDVIPDSDLENFLLEDEIKVVGEAGTFIVFDGGTLPHRGGLLKNNERVALQVIFGNYNSVYRRIINKLKNYIK